MTALAAGLGALGGFIAVFPTRGKGTAPVVSSAPPARPLNGFKDPERDPERDPDKDPATGHGGQIKKERGWCL